MLELKKERYEINRICLEDEGSRRLFLAKAKKDVVWWCNNFVSTYDPRRPDPVLPFLLFPRQEEILRAFSYCYQEKQWAVFKKSRDVGATWLGVVFMTHQWLFYPLFNGGIGSRKAELVDRADNPDCIFEKFRMLLRWLPAWMQPEGWDRESKIMLLKNPQNGSTIVGSGGDGIGRGGRSSFFFADEFAFVERSQRVMSALSQNTDCCILTSTVNGTNNEFYRVTTSGNYPVLQIHWKDDPRKNAWIADDGTTGNGWNAPIGAIYPWYEEQRRRFSPAIVAQEIDIDFTASVEGIYIPSQWVTACIDAHLRIDDIGGNALHAGLDVATEGSNKTVLIVRAGGVVQSIQEWQGTDTTQTTFRVHDYMVNAQIELLTFDADGVGAGVAGTLAAISDKPYWVEVFHGAGSPNDHLYWEGEKKTSKQKFANKRAEAWGILRERIKKTYEVVSGIKEHPADELISLPNDGELITQLSQPVVKYNSSGKILLESKQDLRKRGLSSPDKADALALAFYPSTNLGWMNEL